MRKRTVVSLILLAFCLNLMQVSGVFAQAGGTDAPERPGDRRQEFPELPLKEKALPPVLTLPRIPEKPYEGQLSSAMGVRVNKIELNGNTVYSDTELAVVTERYEGRIVTVKELQALRNALTLYYVERGYINSGAVIPEQKVDNGVIEIRIVEGRLTEIEVSGNDRVNDDYITGRLRIGSEQTLNLVQMQERIKLLYLDGLIQSVNADLIPGLRRGEAKLRIKVEENRPYQFGLSFNNQRSPSVGEYQGEIYGSVFNLTGFGDALRGRFNITDGLDNYFVSYGLPFNAYDSRFRIYFDRTDAVVVEQPFDKAQIKSESETFGITLSHPLYRTAENQLSLELIGEKRRSRSRIESIPNDQSFPFPASGPNGISEVTVLRFVQELLDRDSGHVLAFRSTFNVGIDVFDATTVGGNVPDGLFFSWLGQFQWVQRLWDTGNQLLIRSNLQLTPDPLLNLEKFGLGGAYSVRGYRENQLVRDNGWFASAEVRFPVLRIPIPGISKDAADGTVQFAVFYDVGWSENTDEASPAPTSFTTISSVGLGLRWDPHRKIHSEIYWGFPLRDIEDDEGEHSLQDAGVHFSLNVQMF